MMVISYAIARTNPIRSSPSSMETITFRDDDSSVFKRHIPALNTSSITEHPDELCTAGWRARVEGRCQALLCVAEVAGEVTLPHWVLVLGSRNK